MKPVGGCISTRASSPTATVIVEDLMEAREPRANRPPTDVVGRALGGPMGGQYVRVHDDFPGGIYVYWSLRPDFTGEGWDNWFPSWQEVERFFVNTVGNVSWGEQ